jgi:hypothetical protein
MIDATFAVKTHGRTSATKKINYDQQVTVPQYKIYSSTGVAP